MLRWASIGLASIATVAASPAGAHTSGAYALQAAIPMRSMPGPCPSSVSNAYLCGIRSGGAAIPGLGQVTEAYVHVVYQCGGDFSLAPTTARFVVQGKGTIEIALDATTACVPSALEAARRFTVTGGSGAFAGASGDGTVTHQASYTSDGGASGTDTWVGSLTVPGVEFDLTPPVIAASNKVVRAPRHAKHVRVRYRVSADDAVDGALPVSCKPRSGSRFKLGRTVVRCAASDHSANTQTAQFTVTVRR